jgi:hypothetical protein
MSTAYTETPIVNAQYVNIPEVSKYISWLELGK